MPSVSFDGQNLKVQLSGSGSYDTQSDIYSAWKEWVAIGDNAKYPPAFDTTGGDATGGGQSIAPYFFLRNDLGWKVRAPEQDGEVTVQGNLFPRDPNLATFEQATGYDAFIRLEVSTRAVVVETGTSGLTSSEAQRLADIYARLDLNTDTPNTYSNDSSKIENDNFSLVRSDNNDGTFTVNRE